MMVPSLDGLEQSDLPGFPLFVELVSTCVAQPGLTTGQLLELYRGTKFSQSLETLATWNHMIVDDEVDTMFKDALGSMYDDALERRLEELIARDRTHVLSAEERREFWTLSQALKKQ